MSDLVSKCVLRLEVDSNQTSGNNLHSQTKKPSTIHCFLESQGAEAASPLESETKQRARGQRVRNISVETFPSRLEGSRDDWGLLPVSSREQTPMTEKDPVELAEDKGEIGFFSGNPFVEVTKGILHLYKEE